MFDDEHGPVPDDVRCLIEFLNTVDIETGTDALAESSSFAQWLSSTRLVRRRALPNARELRVARTLRDGLRAVAASNSGQSSDHRMLDAASRVLDALPIHLRVVTSGAPLEAKGEGVGEALARIGVAYASAIVRSRFARIKLCAAPNCRWAYWDNSKNGSRRWCAMGVCGARSKMRDYRERTRRTPALARPTRSAKSQGASHH